MDIKVSIIIPVYNVECYLSECLNSILQQNFHDYEIICINDASTDNSNKILLDYAEKYNHIKIVTHSDNKGLSAARNTGMSFAQGKYIWFVDSDDMITLNSLPELYNIAEENQVDMVYFNMHLINDSRSNSESKNEQSLLWNEYIGVYSGITLFCLFVENHQRKPQSWRVFIRRGFLEENRLTFYNGILHEDELFSFLCSMKAQRVINVNKDYYIHRIRKNSIITGIKNYKRAESLFVILIQIIMFWGTHDFTQEENRTIGAYFENMFETYKYYCCFGKKDELEVGGYLERLLYSILYKKQKKWLNLNEQQLNQIKKVKDVIIFGAGRAAADIVSTLNERNIKINAVVVSDASSNPKQFCGINVYSIDDIAHRIKNAVVIIGVTEKYSIGNIQEKLNQMGCNNIIIAQKPIAVEE